MNKEELIAMGLTEEQSKKVMDSLDGNYVTKARFNEVNEELKKQKAAVSDRDKQLEDLKKSSGDNAELKKQIEALQQQNTEQKKSHDAEIAQLKLDNAVRTAMTASGAKNIKALTGFIDLAKVKLGEDGKLTGLDEQIKEIQKAEPYLFAEKQQNNFRGFQPGASGDVKPGADVDFSKMTYSEMTAYIAANPDVKIQ